jgi:hypothetical protein
VAKKKPENAVPEKPDPEYTKNTLQIHQAPDENERAAVVKAAASPIVRGALTARKFVPNIFGETDISAYVERLSAQSQAVVAGDLSALERMLVTQAGTLDAIFNYAATKAAGSSHLPQQEAFMRQALKAQQQCANTVKVLGELKTPKSVAFIKQQNNAAGHQQVNNGAAPSTVTRAHGKTIDQSNELLAEDHGTTTLDTGAARAAGGGNQALEAVGAVHRAAD